MTAIERQKSGKKERINRMKLFEPDQKNEEKEKSQQ